MERLELQAASRKPVSGIHLTVDAMAGV